MADPDDDNCQRIVDLTRELMAKGMLIDGLSDKISELEKQIESVSATAPAKVDDESRMRVLELQHKNVKFKQCLQTTQRVLSMEKSSHGELRQILSSIDNDFGAFVTESRRKLELRFLDQSRTEELLRAEKLSLEGQLEDLEKDSTAEKALLEEKIATLVQTIDANSSETSSLLTASNNELTLLRTEVDNLSAEKTTLTMSLIDLETELKTARNSAGESAQKREQELATLKSKLATLKSKLAASEKEVCRLTKEVNNEHDENALFSSRVLSANKKISDLNELIRKKSENNEKLNEELATLKAAMVAVSEKLENAREEVLNANVRMKEQSGAINTVTQERDDAILEGKRLSTELLNLQDDRNRDEEGLNSNLAKLRDQMVDQQKHISQQIIEAKQLSNKLFALEAQQEEDARTHEGVISQLKASHKKSIEQMKADHEKNIGDLSAKERSLGELAGKQSLEIDKLKSSIIQKDEASTKKDEEILRLQMAVHKACDERTELQEKLDKIKQGGIIDENGSPCFKWDGAPMSQPKPPPEAEEKWVVERGGRGTGSNRGRRRKGTLS